MGLPESLWWPMEQTQAFAVAPERNLMRAMMLMEEEPQQ
jgi:hypothetical protein